MKNLFSKARIKTLIGVSTLMAVMLMPISVNALSASSADYFGSSSSQAACDALSGLDSSQSCGTGTSTIDTLITTVINILSIIVGIIAVIMIIVSGMRFITSGGESQKVAGAKSALIYALIGLVIVALSQVMVHFVLHASVQATTPPPAKVKKKVG